MVKLDRFKGRTCSIIYPLEKVLEVKKLAILNICNNSSVANFGNSVLVVWRFRAQCIVWCYSYRQSCWSYKEEKLSVIISPTLIKQ